MRKATASVVLNGSGRVSAALRLRVLDAVEALGYRLPRATGAAAPRSAIRSAGRGIGVVVKELDSPFYAGVIAGVRAYAREHGYTPVVASSERDAEREHHAVALLAAADVAGLIVAPVLDERADLSRLFELRRRRVAFVLLGGVHGVPACQVVPDEVAASRTAGEHLIQQGYTRVLHFAGPARSTPAAERLEGLRHACAAARVSFTDGDVIPTGAHLESGYRAAHAYFTACPPAPGERVGATCFNDLVAIGVCRALAELGLRMPEDVAVVGHDDIELLQYLPVPLTSMRVPAPDMGRMATELLLRQLGGGAGEGPCRLHVRAQLVVRGSTPVVSTHG